MKTIQLQRISGAGLTEKQWADLENLAFSCPLEAGNAVYRARRILRKMGDYIFDDAVIYNFDKAPEIEIKGDRNKFQIRLLSNQ